MTTLESMTAVLSTLAALVAVLLAAWFVLKWMGRKMPGQTSSRHIKVLDRVMLGQDKCLVLVRVANKTMLVGITSGTAVKLCDVDADELEPEPEKPEGQSFSALFQTILKKRGDGASTDANGGEEAEKWRK